MRPVTIWRSDTEFEKDVIRIAQSLWPSAEIGGAVVLEGRERDGVFITEEAIHIVECTTSRAKQKAAEDSEKSIRLARELRKRYDGKPVQCWFITSEEPTADQRTVVTAKKEFPSVALSYSVFRSRLIDANAYLNTRRDYPFGSARNLRDGTPKLGRDEYIGLDLLQLADSSAWSVARVADGLLLGAFQQAILLGDYGAGKSMTLREIYLTLVDAYFEGRSSRFPVYINLRDHSGQQDTAEVLERHARRIGFPNPSHLVRAWRAGYVVMMLDGFDELSSTGWLAFNKRLRNVRHATVEVIRRFVDETPVDAPVIVVGRVSYFDNEEECLQALGTSKGKVSVFSLNDFSEEQVAAYLQRMGLYGTLPSWLPARPLLIGYLGARGALHLNQDGDNEDPGSGWDDLLSLVCEREARTHEAVDPDTVRSVIEHLASVARAKGSLGSPLSPPDMIESYRRVVGFEPDQRAEALLMRLPGLGYSEEGGGGRAFVDSDFASAAAAGDVTRYISNPFGMATDSIVHVKEVLQETGVAVAIRQLEKAGTPHEKIFVALAAASAVGDLAMPEHGLAADLLKLVTSGSFSDPREPPTLLIRDVLIDELDLTNCGGGLAGISLRDCLIATLYLPENSHKDTGFPKFRSCEIDHLEGRAAEGNLLADMFRTSKIETFSAIPATNAAVLEAKDLEPGIKALVTILRKLFFQKGAGRKENAFFRGVPGIGNPTIDKALHLIGSAGYASRIKRGGAEAVWVPNRRMTARAKMIVQMPKASKEPIVSAARAIDGS